MPFSPLKTEIFQQNLRVGYAYIDFKLFSIMGDGLHARPTSHHIKHNSNTEKKIQERKK